MSIKVKLSKIVVAFQSKAVERLESMVPPGSYRFDVAEMLESLTELYQRYLNEQNEACRTYGYLDKEKNQYVVNDLRNSPENMDSFNKVMAELLAKEVEVAGEPVSFAKLGPKAIDELSCGTCKLLRPFLVK